MLNDAARRRQIMAAAPGGGVPTPPEVFFDRRGFLKTAAAAAAATAPVACGQKLGFADDSVKLQPPIDWPASVEPRRNTTIGLPGDVARHELTPRAVAGTHNNFYEFLFGRGGPVWRDAQAFTVSPWTVQVTGACAKPYTIDLDGLFKIAHEERLYHFRCVERWAMNVPWSGFALKTLLERAEPNADARFVRFISAHRPEQMPGLKHPGAAAYKWPYHEALRMDEAMHDLTFVATGVYGAPLLRQHGAPIRLIVPWKYGYKSPKSIERIEIVTDQPPTFWSRGASGHEYGFLSNVNPNIPHPRWSQRESYWLDTRERFATPIFNGYRNLVASLYPDEPTTPQPALRAGETAR